MTKKRKYHSQKVVFNVPSTINKDIFLEFAMSIIGDRYVHIETKFDKITFDIQGDRNDLRTITEKLTLISYQINNAFHGTNGHYIYSVELLNKLFRPQLQLKFFKKSIEIYGYSAIILDNALSTEANYLQLQDIHRLAVNAMKEMQSEQNRDIHKFFSLLYLQSNLKEFQIAEIALENKVLEVANNKYYFAMDQEKAYHSMLELLNTKTYPAIEVSTDKELQLSDFFDGGKIVFMKNREELDSSPFDIVNNIENKEE